MTDSAIVQSFERVTDDSGESVEVKIDEVGGPLLTIENYVPCGDDAPPLDTDFVAVKEAAGRGTNQAVGYQDPKNKGKALGGEKRIYARDPDDGSVVAEIWLKGAGTIALISIKAGSSIELNGVLIDQQGNITTPGDVTAKNGSPATSVALSTHKHGSGTGPTSAPLPGT